MATERFGTFRTPSKPPSRRENKLSSARLVGLPIPSFAIGMSRVHTLGATLTTLLFTASLSAAELDFSHQLHLKKVGASCTHCHASATGSTEATDLNLPKEESCLICHNGEIVPTVDTSPLSIQRTDKRTFRFNHSFHLKLGNFAPILASAIDGGSYLGKPGDIRHHLNTNNPCEACHRGLDETDFATLANLPQMSDCLVCHSDIDAPYSCHKCHIEGVQLKPDDHTLEFADLHSTGKLDLDKSSCLPCHGTTFTCKGCH